MPAALITGASSGLGRALASALLERGWTVIIDARHPEALYRVRDEGSTQGTVLAIAGDVTAPAHREELVRAVAANGNLDLLVNNASSLGPSPLPPLHELEAVQLRAILEVNVIAPLQLIRSVLPELASHAAVVNISSDAAVEAYPGWGGYGASKAALDHLTRTLAAEHPELRWYSVDPGDLRTPMHQAAFPGEDISDRPEPETAVPPLLALLQQRPVSGRYRLTDFPADPTADVPTDHPADRPADVHPADVHSAVTA